MGVAGFCLALVVPVQASRPDPVVTCRVELDRRVLPAAQANTGVVKVTLDAARAPAKGARPPVNLAIVMDRSGSMSGEKLEKAKDAAIEALHHLEARDRFSLVVYNHTVETVVPAQSAANTQWIESRIRAIQASGNTALFGGVSQAAAEVRKNLGESAVHRVILLSDGLANVGPSSPEDLGRLGAGLLKEGVAVTTVGVGTDYHEDLMARLAQESDGNTYFVENSRDLPRIFSAELGDVLSVVARKVNLVIDCPEGIRPIQVMGRDGRIRGQRVELAMNQLYGGQAKYALVEVEIPGGPAGTTREVASARVSYDNALTLEREEVSGSTTGRFSADESEVASAVNVEVQRAYEYNRNALTQQRAIDLADQGKVEEAAGELRESARKLKATGLRNNDSALEQKAGEMTRQADDLERDGMSSRERKELRTEAQQEINQQVNH
jgi:Ca-activated chloride channel family protein